MRSIKHSEAARINGIKAGIFSKQKAIEKYNSNPNACKLCNKIMVLTEGQRPFEINKKTFCSHSCSAKFTNSRRHEAEGRKACSFCGKRIKNKLAKCCIECRSVFLHEETGNLLKKSVSRERISSHARRVMKNNLSSCLVCGYDFAVEAAHINPVKGFSSESTVREINTLENLIPLCPNHHLEFDRGKIKLEEILRACGPTEKTQSYEL